MKNNFKENEELDIIVLIEKNKVNVAKLIVAEFLEGQKVFC